MVKEPRFRVWFDTSRAQHSNALDYINCQRNSSETIRRLIVQGRTLEELAEHASINLEDKIENKVGASKPSTKLTVRFNGADVGDENSRYGQVIKDIYGAIQEESRQELLLGLILKGYLLESGEWQNMGLLQFGTVEVRPEPEIVSVPGVNEIEDKMSAAKKGLKGLM